MGEYFHKVFSAFLLLSMLTACQSAASVTQVIPTQPSSPPASQPTQAHQPANTLPAESVVPNMPYPEDLSPTLLTPPTPQGISQEMDALIPHIPPAQLAATRNFQGVLLTWLGTGSDIDSHYTVYRRPAGNPAWEVLGFVAVQGDNRGTYSYLDASAEAGQSYEYSVTTFDRYGKESERATILAEPTP